MSDLVNSNDRGAKNYVANGFSNTRYVLKEVYGNGKSHSFTGDDGKSYSSMNIEYEWVEVGAKTGLGGDNWLSNAFNNASLSSMRPVAYSLETNVGYEGAGAVSSSPISALVILRGKDRFKVKGFSSAGLGVGILEISATVTGTTYFYSGNIENFDHKIFEGTSYDIEVTAGEVIVGGAIVTYTENINHPGEYLIGIGGSLGFGVGTPISGNVTWQQTQLW